jgi:hypothetical protein
MRYTITKIRNGLWVYENEKGVKTQHSMQSGAEKMALSQEHFHRPADQAIDIVKDK